MSAHGAGGSPGPKPRWQLIALAAAVAAALSVALASEWQRRGRPSARRGVMCDRCERAEDCQPGLGCVNGTCETAPPSCHVKIGL